MNRLRTVAAALATTGLILGLSACSSDDEPSETPSSTKAAATTPAANIAPDWEAAYTPEQLAAYRQALARLDAYERDSQPIFAEGKASPQAKKILQEYFFTYQYLWGSLQYLEKNNYKTTGAVKLLSSEATRAEVSKDGGSVTIRQCVDASDTETTQNGKVVPSAYAARHLREVVLSTPAGGGEYLISQYENEDTPCDA